MDPSLGSGSLNNLVWHYTNTQGLFGILNSDTIWASGASFMNDPQELTSGLKELEACARDISTEHPAVCEAAQDFAESVRLKRTHTFVTSACQEPDLLSMWQVYGKSRDVAYSVGLRRDVPLVPEISTPTKNRYFLLPEACMDGGRYLPTETEGVAKLDLEDDSGGANDPFQVNADDGATWSAVVYGESDTSALVRRILDSLIVADAKVTEATDSEYLIFSPESILSDMNLVKSSAYSGEKEWRIVWPAAGVWMKPYLRHRASQFGVTPYVALCRHDGQRLDLDQSGVSRNPLPVEAIMVGPSPYQKEALETLPELLELNGYYGVMVLASEAQFRP